MNCKSLGLITLLAVLSATVGRGQEATPICPEMKKYYYDASKYNTYLEKLGIKYPTVRAEVSSLSLSDADEDEN